MLALVLAGLPDVSAKLPDVEPELLVVELAYQAAEQVLIPTLSLLEPCPPALHKSHSFTVLAKRS